MAYGNPYQGGLLNTPPLRYPHDPTAGFNTRRKFSFSAPSAPAPTPSCPDGYHWDPVTNSCVKSSGGGNGLIPTEPWDSTRNLREMYSPQKEDFNDPYWQNWYNSHPSYGNPTPGTVQDDQGNWHAISNWSTKDWLENYAGDNFYVYGDDDEGYNPEGAPNAGPGTYNPRPWVTSGQEKESKIGEVLSALAGAIGSFSITKQLIAAISNRVDQKKPTQQIVEEVKDEATTITPTIPKNSKDIVDSRPDLTIDENGNIIDADGDIRNPNNPHEVVGKPGEGSTFKDKDGKGGYIIHSDSPPPPPSNNDDNDPPDYGQDHDFGYSSTDDEVEDLVGDEDENRGGVIGYNSGGRVGYNQGGKALSNKIRKIYNEGKTAPGQAYAIAKSMGYNMGGMMGYNDGGRAPQQPHNMPMYNSGGGLMNHPYAREGEHFDTIKANLTPGEFVVDADSAEKFGGLLRKINEWEPKRVNVRNKQEAEMMVQMGKANKDTIFTLPNGVTGSIG